jgi:hypothetical protein
MSGKMERTSRLAQRMSCNDGILSFYGGLHCMGILRLGFYLQLQSPRAVDTINYITSCSIYTIVSSLTSYGKHFEALRLSYDLLVTLHSQLLISFTSIACTSWTAPSPTHFVRSKEWGADAICKF